MIKFLCLILFISLVECQPDPPNGFNHSIYLDSQEKFQVFWKYDADTITFEVQVMTVGYVGLGISERGKMAGSDVVIARFVAGQPELTDRHASGNVLPELDSEQNWRLLAARQTNAHSVFRFSRYLRVCDSASTSNEDMDINDGTVRLIYAYSDSDDLEYHGTHRRGSKSVQLLRVMPTSGNLPEDAHYHDFRLRNHNIPPDHTSYFCALLPAPYFRTKHHIVAFETLLTAGNEGTVHHITVYGCYDRPSDGRRIGDQWNCYNAGTNMPSSRCTSSIFGWAVGASRFYFPADTGFPIGGATQPSYMFLEIHYDNQGLRQDVMDSSGLRLWVSPTVRRFDTGVLQVGTAIGPDFQIIPPRQTEWTTHGHCPNSCLREAMQGRREGVNVFAHMLHTHSTGTKVDIRHIRGFRELNPIAADQNYDFNFQELRLMKEEANLKPEDSLVVECTYDTRTKTNVLKGGMSTRSEMCYAYLLYYPVLDLTWCLSYPTAKQTLSGIPDVGSQNVVEHQADNVGGIGFPEPIPQAEGSFVPQPGPGKQVQHTEPALGMSLDGTYSIQSGPYRGMNIDRVLGVQDWSRGNLNVSLQQAVLSGQIGTFCMHETRKYQSSGRVELVPNIWYPYVETQQQCKYGQPPVTAASTSATENAESCRDRNATQCAWWRSYCTTFPQVRNYCQRTCNGCPITTGITAPLCEDFFNWCRGTTFCTRGLTRFMCPKSCRFCNNSDCLDQSPYCGTWSQDGYCQSSDSVQILCPRTCRSGCGGRA